MRAIPHLVSVVVPHYNDLSNLQSCLRRLAEQDMPAGSFDVIVADNNSACGLDAVRAVAGHSAQVVLAKEQGAGPARNAGAGASRGEILAFIDSDCVPASDWLRQGVAALATADFVGGQVKVLAESPGRLSPTEAFETVFAFDFESYITRKNFTGSGNMFVSRRVFEDVGGFRRTVSEDMEWSHRAIAKGYRLGYAPLAIVGHPARRTWAELARKWQRLVREAHAYDQLNGGSVAKWMLRACAVLVSPVLHVPNVLFSPKLTSIRDRLNALTILFAIRAFRFVEMLKVGCWSTASSANKGSAS